MLSFYAFLPGREMLACCGAEGLEAAKTPQNAALLHGGRVEAGFPSPADDYLDGALDLNEYLVRNRSATFFVRVSGESMTGAGIFPNDLLIVDRSLTAGHGDVVIAVVDGEFTVKRLFSLGGIIELRPENPNFEPVRLSEASQMDIWGVVKHVIHSP
ncbi:MAG: translesion error-prone DNA polymerase V autoproteolytic subunit [Planctomycetes bacterium]|nr:translesion error-prone DNA polymerase V autoproteolytic subunit [Planctomycetota bacterium]